MADGCKDALRGILEEAGRMLEEGAPLRGIIDKLWYDFGFHTARPFYRDGLLPLAYGLYAAHKDRGVPDAVPHCMLLLGRIYNAKGEYLPACRFYLVARRTFQDEHGIIAMEFFREELRSEGGQKQIGLSKEKFEARYAGDTAEGLVREYGGACA